MVILKNNIAYFVLLLLLCGAWLSKARLHPSDARVDDISATKGSVASDDENLKKPSAKEVVRKCGNIGKSSSSSSNAEIIKRSLRTHLSGEVDAGFVAFTADYHSPRHHPPKNNK